MAYVSGVISSDLPCEGVNTAQGPIKIGIPFSGEGVCTVTKASPVLQIIGTNDKAQRGCNWGLFNCYG